MVKQKLLDSTWTRVPWHFWSKYF